MALVPPQVRYHIRWMIQRDMPEILCIENAAAATPWTEEEFRACLHKRSCIGMVAEHGERVVGFMVYELTKGQFNLLNLAVHPQHRRKGIGQLLCAKLQSKLALDRRPSLRLVVPETNLPAQLFFRAVGVKATQVLRHHFATDEDGFVMEQTLLPLVEAAGSPGSVGHNRIAPYLDV